MVVFRYIKQEKCLYLEGGQARVESCGSILGEKRSDGEKLDGIALRHVGCLPP
jgi:hypothetical protein